MASGLKRIAAALWLALAWAPVQAQPVVVELYTSQGCSSCPPADALMRDLSMRDDVIALALHVDYWDYLGWKDDFADPAFTNRQKLYARARNSRTVYTPQMIVGGSEFVVGFKPEALAGHIDTHKSRRPPVALSVGSRGDRLTIEVAPKGAPVERASVYVVTFLDHRAVDIGRGENAGRTIDYYNIVTSWTRVGIWEGRGAERFNVDLKTDQRAVVIVQEEDFGPVLAAARVE